MNKGDFAGVIASWLKQSTDTKAATRPCFIIRGSAYTFLYSVGVGNICLVHVIIIPIRAWTTTSNQGFSLYLESKLNLIISALGCRLVSQCLCNNKTAMSIRIQQCNTFFFFPASFSYTERRIDIWWLKSLLFKLPNYVYISCWGKDAVPVCLKSCLKNYA